MWCIIKNSTLPQRKQPSIPKDHACQGGIPTSTAARNAQPLGIHQPLACKVLGSIAAIVHIHNAPLACQPLSILPTIPGAATIVDVGNGKPTAGPVLLTQAVHDTRACSGAPMNLHKQGGELAFRECIVLVGGLW